MRDLFQASRASASAVMMDSCTAVYIRMADQVQPWRHRGPDILGIAPKAVQDGVLVAKGVLAVHCEPDLSVLACKVLHSRFLQVNGHRT